MAYILIAETPPSIGDPMGDEPIRTDVLALEMQEGKKGQSQFLQSVLPRAIPFIGEHLSKETTVCICCHNGKDASVGTALAALQIYFDDNGKFVARVEERERMRKFCTILDSRILIGLQGDKQTRSRSPPAYNGSSLVDLKPTLLAQL